MATTSLFFDIFARDRGVESTLNRIGDTAQNTDTRFNKFGKTMNNLAGPAAIGLGAVGALALKFGGMAAEAEQNVGAVETVFGRAADKVKEYADEAATAVGLSESAYNQLSATTGTALKAAGVSFDELAERHARQRLRREWSHRGRELGRRVEERSGPGLERPDPALELGAVLRRNAAGVEHDGGDALLEAGHDQPLAYAFHRRERGSDEVVRIAHGDADRQCARAWHCFSAKAVYIGTA